MNSLEVLQRCAEIQAEEDKKAYIFEWWLEIYQLVVSCFEAIDQAAYSEKRWQSPLYQHYYTFIHNLRFAKRQYFMQLDPVELISDIGSTYEVFMECNCEQHLHKLTVCYKKFLEAKDRLQAGFRLLIEKDQEEY